MSKVSFVHTKDNHCMGCNKCIFVCPVGANEAFFEAGAGKVFIKSGYCISCGACISICDHDARDYFDDLDVFFSAIKENKKISVVIAPAARFTVGSLKRIISYFKSLGVNKVYDVSFGADICTWGHVKAIKEYNLNKFITQPCPVVVSYVEKYEPELIEKLSPVQSPVVCLSIYLKKYLGIEDDIVFLSPCIGKKRECGNEYTADNLKYNITFKSFLEHLEENNIDLNDYQEQEFDNVEGGLGFAFPRPGGLSENIKYNLEDDVWIKEIEGIQNIKEYLTEYKRDVEEGKDVPFMVDTLNCEHGCNFGTGTKPKVRQNEVDSIINSKKKDLSKENSVKLMEFFNKSLNYSDFVRQYIDRSVDYKKDVTIDMEGAFISLGKLTEEDRNINCFCCGYGNCHDFVYDLATGHNDRNNCRHYLLNKFKKLSVFDDLTGLNNRYSYNLTIEAFKKNGPEFIGIAFIDINGLKEANDTYGHSYGDGLIICCANILKKVFSIKVYRIGGDEFVVLDDDVTEEEFNSKMETLVLLLKSEKELVVSVGSSLFTKDEDVLLKLEEADQAMYKAKQEYYKKIGRADRRKR